MAPLRPCFTSPSALSAPELSDNDQHPGESAGTSLVRRRQPREGERTRPSTERAPSGVARGLGALLANRLAPLMERHAAARARRTARRQ